MNVLATLGTILGAVGGIPQLVRWFGNRPKLNIENVNLWYQPLANHPTYYTYVEKGQAQAVQAKISVFFQVGNGKTRLRRLKCADATGIVVAVSLHDVETGERIHNFSHNEQDSVLASDTYLPVNQEIPLSLSSPKYRVIIRARCKGSSARLDVIVPIELVQSLDEHILG